MNNDQYAHRSIVIYEAFPAFVRSEQFSLSILPTPVVVVWPRSRLNFCTSFHQMLRLIALIPLTDFYYI